MQVVDALIYSILVLFPFEAVVFDVIDGFEVDRAPECIGQLIFESTQSEQKIYGGKNTRMEQ